MPDKYPAEELPIYATPLPPAVENGWIDDREDSENESEYGFGTWESVDNTWKMNQWIGAVALAVGALMYYDKGDPLAIYIGDGMLAVSTGIRAGIRLALMRQTSQSAEAQN